MCARAAKHHGTSACCAHPDMRACATMWVAAASAVILEESDERDHGPGLADGMLVPEVDPSAVPARRARSQGTVAAARGVAWAHGVARARDVAKARAGAATNGAAAAHEVCEVPEPTPPLERMASHALMASYVPMVSHERPRGRQTHGVAGAH